MYFTHPLRNNRCSSCRALLLLACIAAIGWSSPSGAEALRLSAYVTAGTARAFLDVDLRQAARERLQELHVSGVILESNRGGDALSEAELRTLHDFFMAAGFRVSGGIATVPGGNWGVPANEGLAWLNFTNPKTQADVEAAVRTAARVFDRLIVDDFLLSGDKSAEAETARNGRSWPEYRRDLLTALSQRMIIGPAKEENPDITVILKFPQSYDRYHTFGYDVEREPQLYDEVWVGTETRGQYTQRFGFTQPFEGFVNYRWIDSLSHGKLGGAWFDFGDCDEADYIEQAWQTVLAGAREIVLFSYGGIDSPHPGNARLFQERPALEQLARAVADHPVTGVATYKPPNSDPGSDMYCMDFIGMLGIPLVPVAEFPEDAESLFVPAYGAKDAGIVHRIETAVWRGKNVVITTGLLAGALDGDRLAALAGLAAIPDVSHIRTDSVLLDGMPVTVPRGLDLGGSLAPGAAEVLLSAVVDGEPAPYLTTHVVGKGRLSVLNLHMFTWSDFEAAHEVLLSPRNLGLLDVPEAWAKVLRQTFRGGGEVLSKAPTRVTLQPLGDRGWFVQNYNNTPAAIELELGATDPGALHDGFTGLPLAWSGAALSYEVPARSRLWVAH